MIHAGLEESDFESVAAGQAGRPDAKEIRIAYAGTIIVEEEFALFVRALARIRSRLDRPVTLEIFGSHSYQSREWFDAAWIRERGNLREPELLQALRQCDWGFAPMALSDDDPRYNRFSFPTKFISYLAAGLPVITLGHPESSVVKMAVAYRVGPCIQSGEAGVLEQELQAAFAVSNAREKFSGEILRCARSEFDAGRMRKTLHECFLGCAGKRSRPD